MAKHSHTVIAELYGFDSREIHECRHHYGQTKRPIYVIGDDYFATGKTKPTDEYGTGWALEGEVNGVKVWKSNC